MPAQRTRGTGPCSGVPGCDDPLVLGDHHPVAIEAGGRRFFLRPWFADAVSDMCLLGAPDEQEFSDDAEAFEEWLKARPLFH